MNTTVKTAYAAIMNKTFGGDAIQVLKHLGRPEAAAEYVDSIVAGVPKAELLEPLAGDVTAFINRASGHFASGSNGSKGAVQTLEHQTVAEYSVSQDGVVTVLHHSPPGAATQSTLTRDAFDETYTVQTTPQGTYSLYRDDHGADPDMSQVLHSTNDGQVQLLQRRAIAPIYPDQQLDQHDTVQTVVKVGDDVIELNLHTAEQADRLRPRDPESFDPGKQYPSAQTAEQAFEQISEAHRTGRTAP